MRAPSCQRGACSSDTAPRDQAEALRAAGAERVVTDAEPGRGRRLALRLGGLVEGDALKPGDVLLLVSPLVLGATWPLRLRAPEGLAARGIAVRIVGEDRGPVLYARPEALWELRVRWLSRMATHSASHRVYTRKVRPRPGQPRSMARGRGRTGA